MRKRILSVLLCLVMVTSLLPTAVFAEGEEGGNDGGTTVVVPDGKAVIIKDNTSTEYDTLDAAMDAASSGDTIYLGAETYCGNATSPTTAGKGARKSLTFVGAGTDKTTWQIRAPQTAYGSDGWCDYSFDGSDSITFKNMTVVGSVYPDETTKANNTQGLVRINHITLKDCIFNGRADYWGYETTTFENVIFNAPGTEKSGVTDKTDYSLWTYTGNTYTFKNCTFNSTGKTINVYRHNKGQFKSNVTINFESCTVKNTTHEKQAMKINDETMGAYKYIINISGNNKVEGIEPNAITCSRLFGFDEAGENAGKTIVNIENEKVWENSARVGNHNHDFTTGSYDNGVAEGNANQYTDGYKDNAFSTTYGSWQWDQVENKLARTVTKTCKYCGATVETTEYKDLELDVSRSKTATALDSSDQSTVTLSLPSAQEKLVSDVVFVLDESDCNEDVLTKMTGLLSGLRETAQANNASINVGVIFFRGIAVTAYPLTKYTGDNQPILDAINNANSQMTLKGTNLPAGLQAAKTMLSESNTSSSRQYMILISDGATYLYTHNDDPTTHYSRTSGYCNMDGGLYEWQAKYDPDPLTGADAYALPESFSSNGEATDWENFLNEIASNRETFVSFDQEYVRTKDKAVAGLTKPDPIYTGDTIKDFVTNVEESFYQSATAYQQIVKSGVNCYSIAVNDNMGVFTTFANYLAELGKGSGMNFDSIKNDILYAVGEGSVVEDKMGADFDFVPGSLKLTVGGKELASKVDETDKNVVYFGDDENDLNKDAYRFKVVYDSTEDKFTWTINENVSNFAPVQLSYQVKLVNRNTAAGTYFVPTNEYAKLTPKNSAGYIGKALEFNKPEVSYTVSGGGGGGSTTYYYFSLEKVDAQDSHTLNGAKFGLYLDGTQIATATSNSSGIATFRVDTSSYRKIDTTSSLYYQELTAPEGYVLSSDKIDIAKSDLVTSQTTAEKNAETVRNYRTSTPDQLNDADHFAYVIGYEDGTVRPNSQISRAETATIFFRLLKDSVRDGNLLTSNAYADVLNSYWANTAISTMTGLGIVQGRSSTTFDPQAPITRAEFAAICARFDTGTSSGAQTFSDISGHWAEKYIQRAAELGWIKGFEDGSFRPDTYITRAQAMTMVNRVLNRIPEETSDLLSNMNVWPDCTTNDWFYLAVQEATNSHDFKHKAGNYETWTGMKADPDWTRYEK